ncbi:hypothetical protein EDB81DRAFT_950399 [Dactylonectria macrodidyma]|uniref:Uncharacterized protein n=1 Tax=Dactylonectria macrodidyma TaxID=307937 RepID=A0A9P9E4M5_9HYPO|nr:hypothetical protein EDB81DRAFT_950399 [Dactylonectria macrodidyma]
MAVIYVEIDPDGDILMILPHFIDLAWWDEDIPPPDDDEEPKEADDDRQSLASEATEEPSTIETHFKVSVKHLTMASRRAKPMFAGNYIETQPQADGLCHWKFEPIFHPRAFEYVMNAIHGQTQKLPNVVSLQSLALIAVVVDDLDCRHALWFFADIWIDHLGASVPDKICSDLCRWILISFVFEKPGPFKSATRVAILESKGPFSPDGLPIRPKMIEMIDAEREGLLEVLIAQLHSLIQRISDGVTCHVECRSNVVGILIHEMMSTKAFSPRPCRPFVALQLSAVTGMIRDFKLPGLYVSRGGRDGVPTNTWFVCRTKYIYSTTQDPMDDCGDIEIYMQSTRKERPSTLGRYVGRHECQLQTLVSSEITNLQTKVNGLELSDFV